MLRKVIRYLDETQRKGDLKIEALMHMFKAGHKKDAEEEKIFVPESRFFASVCENFFTANAIRAYMNYDEALLGN